MAEIKFTTERMVEVKSRIDDIASQLAKAIDQANELLDAISSNIQSDNIKSVLSSYISVSLEHSMDTRSNLEMLHAYLSEKIGTYTAIDQAGVDSMSEVESLLSQLNV